MDFATLLIHKGYVGSMEFSEEDDCFFGKVLGIGNNLISYEGGSVEELKSDFVKAIDHYLTSCQDRGVIPFEPTISPEKVKGLGKITTEDQYYSCLSRIEELLPIVNDDTPKDDPNCIELNRIASLVEEYEDIHYPIDSDEVDNIAQP